MDPLAHVQAELIALRTELAAWRECAAARHAYLHSRARVGSHEEMQTAHRMESASRACQPYVNAAIAAAPDRL
ncbi:hypothetical protein ACU4GI_10805 [Cupriavidus basilensis]